MNKFVRLDQFTAVRVLALLGATFPDGTEELAIAVDAAKEFS